MSRYFIGLMSGTSMDGVDAVLAESTADTSTLHSRGHCHGALPPALRAELLALNRSGADELHRAAVAAQGLAWCQAETVGRLLEQAALSPRQVAAIGAHGQTVRHRPPSANAPAGYSLQLQNGSLLAELTGIDVVCDFRSRDIAAGGQGAPLVPAYHAATFGCMNQARAVLNLGGIANLTLLQADGGVLGFDTGPANVLLDTWCQRSLGQDYDAGGAWASGGQVDQALLQSALNDLYFSAPPPKSTGRDHFNAGWLDALLSGKSTGGYRAGTGVDGIGGAHPATTPRLAQDVMSTLSELTACTVTEALNAHAPDTRALYVCGGGAHNADLIRRLRSRLPDADVRTTADLGVAVDQVEALAFAWLARAHLARQPGNVASVTGAAGPRVLGALYPAA